MRWSSGSLATDGAVDVNPAAARELAYSLAPFVRDARVLTAIATVPRDRFVSPELRYRAYENVALPIGDGQTISQPLVVARMLELLELSGSERVLDIGTGSGYHAALLARLAAEVWSIERHPQLSELAREALAELGVQNVELSVGDGSHGLPSRAPFDAINVAAAVEMPVPQPLLDQLAPGGRLVAPLRIGPDSPDSQRLAVIRKDDGVLRQVVLEAVRFVPLVTD
jgi:protein-L-isoaspartate(D-aspartate) O-methyltransferase